MAHRGPDDRGEWRSADDRMWFGFVRLAILDLSGNGAQPMCDPETGNVIVFNGEIYNHLALRRELGGAWRGHSDTETLLASYRQWGAGMLSRLKGMFAFVLYDARTGGLMMARDRFGIKPFYYVQTDSQLLVASEVRAFPADLRGTVSSLGLAAYVRSGACAGTSLLHAGVSSLPPAHTMEVSAEGRIRQWRYWTPALSKERNVPVKTGDSTTQRVRALLEQAVREHLLADVPVASFLSGGIDSSIVTALAAQAAAGALRTFSLGFAEAGFDETAIAEQIARRYGTRHQRVQLDHAEVQQLVLDCVQVLDLPSVDAINTYIISRKVAEAGIKVALSGLGGDELFGGYPIFGEIGRLRWLARVPAVLREPLRLAGANGRRLAELPAGGIAPIVAWRRSFWTNRLLREAGLPVPPYPADPSWDLADEFARVSWAELSHYMADMLLRDSDQVSMAVSLELRVPLLDHELAEYVLGLPAAEKRRFGGVKGLLVEACRDLLPPEVYQRRKMGFALPMDAWMRGPLADFVNHGIVHLKSCRLVSERVIDRLCRGFADRKLHWTRLWSLVVLGHYLYRTNGTEGRNC